MRDWDTQAQLDYSGDLGLSDPPPGSPAARIDVNATRRRMREFARLGTPTPTRVGVGVLVLVLVLE